MTCFVAGPIYSNPPFRGIKSVLCAGDGSTILLNWFKATPHSIHFQVAYNIYFSSNRDDVFTEGVKYVVTDPNRLDGYVSGLTPGDVYYFAVRGSEFEIGSANLNQLPTVVDNNSNVYPEAALISNITDDAMRIPVMDIDTFPGYGVVVIGAELIGYSSVDLVLSELVLSNINQRGLYGSIPAMHTTDGYDGYHYYDPLVKFFTGFDDGSGAVETEENKFDWPRYARTNPDGYKQIFKSLVKADLSMVDASNEDFKPFDYAGWRRTAPDDLLSGKCVGSYYGGQYYCADGYDGVGRVLRGLTFQDHNDQRQEVLLSVTGEPVCLVRRIMEGIPSNTYNSSREGIDYRGLDNFGTNFVNGYEQFFNPRRSDGRILVRFGPSIEELERQDSGLELKFIPDCWTLVYPALKDSDFIIRFNEDGTEEFRYEIANVTRNRTVLTETGAQKFTAIRVRKTDPVYQFRAFRDTSMFPTTITTGLGSVPGPGGLPPHVHSVQVNETITSPSLINEVTGTTLGHRHVILNGVVQVAVGHSHLIIL